MKHTPESAGCDCKACPFSKNGRPHRAVLAMGPSRPVAIVVAESPGGEEVDRGEPLVGATGREFNATLEGVGLKRESLLLMNAMCCRPIQAKTEGDMARAVRACRPYVAAVLSDVDDNTPMLIAGKWAYCSVTGHDEGYANERGFLQPDIRPSTVGKTLRAAEHHKTIPVHPRGDGEDDAG